MRTLSHFTGSLVCFGILLITTSTLCVRSSAQSLDPKKPAPMQADINTGTVDNFVGANYFYFYAEPGKSTITISFKSMGVFGAAQRTTLNIETYDVQRTWVVRKSLYSLKESSQTEFYGEVKKETKIVVAVIPPSGGLIRSGGDYTVKATGAVKFDKPLTDTELIVGTYTPKSIHDNENTAMKLLPDGTLQFASGTTGTWKLFDSDTHLYTLTFGNNRLSLQLIPGRGLVKPSDTQLIEFQRNK